MVLPAGPLMEWQTRVPLPVGNLLQTRVGCISEFCLGNRLAPSPVPVNSVCSLLLGMWDELWQDMKHACTHYTQSPFHLRGNHCAEQCVDSSYLRPPHHYSQPSDHFWSRRDPLSLLLPTPAPIAVPTCVETPSLDTPLCLNNSSL